MPPALLLAFGTLAALLRRAEEGGSWRVTVSLAGTGQWLRGLGRLEGAFGVPVPRLEELGDLLEQPGRAASAPLRRCGIRAVCRIRHPIGRCRRCRSSIYGAAWA